MDRAALIRIGVAGHGGSDSDGVTYALLSHQLAAAPAANTEGPVQVGELGLGLLLSAVIGLEREVRQKSAGLRTHTLAGVGAALFMLVSKYGFSDVLRTGQVVVDPSRVAAQVVTGSGFLGAGLIFVRRDSVHGLTTAASVWVTAAVGAAAGAGAAARGRGHRGVPDRRPCLPVRLPAVAAFRYRDLAAAGPLSGRARRPCAASSRSPPRAASWSTSWPPVPAARTTGTSPVQRTGSAWSRSCCTCTERDR